MDVNKVILLGRIGQDPVLGYTAGGKAYLKFSMATGVNWKDDAGEWQSKTSWHNVQVWGKSAEYLNDKIAKGSRVYLEGSINYSQYEKDGQKIYYTNIIASTVIPMEKQGTTDNVTTTSEEDNSLFNGEGQEEPF